MAYFGFLKKKIPNAHLQRANARSAHLVWHSRAVGELLTYSARMPDHITSLPSVTNVLTWKEFAFVQSKLGWLCLIFGCAHTLFFSWPRLTSVQCNFFLHGA